MSGGQKQRIALARAVYAKKSLYILDCPFSALDKNVRAQIWRKCILGLLLKRNKGASFTNTMDSAVGDSSAYSNDLSTSPISPHVSAMTLESQATTVIISTHYGEELFLNSNVNHHDSNSVPAPTSPVDWVFRLEDGLLADQGLPGDVLTKRGSMTSAVSALEPEAMEEDANGASIPLNSPAKNAVVNSAETEECEFYLSRILHIIFTP